MAEYRLRWPRPTRPRRTIAAALLLIFPGLHAAGDVTPPPDPADEPAARRDRLERDASRNPYAITPHRPNFVLPLSYSFRPLNAGPGLGLSKVDELEVKFQLSFKVLVFETPAGWPIDVYAAYTNRSWWQAYNEDESSPFRETNHEPEVFIRTTEPLRWGGIDEVHFSFGGSHQSNGQTLPRSRSWNRIYAGTDFRLRRVFGTLKVWHRLSERAKEGEDDPRGDDNPAIERNMGSFELALAYVYDSKSVALTLRNNIRTGGDNRGAAQLAFSYPLTRRLKGYVEAFSGYGESLIDHDRSIERLGVGIALTDWP